jgi:hypothetical protein
MADALNNLSFALQHAVIPGSRGLSRSILNHGTSIPDEDSAGQIEDDQGMDAPDEEELDIEMQERVVKSLLDDVSDLDDLSELLTDSSQESVSKPDDLSELLEGLEEKAASDLDDLSDLITSSSAEPESEPDDLSELLTGSSEETVSEPDDLSELLESPSADADIIVNESSATSPDSAEEEQAAALPDEQTKKIPGDYKSKIIALIIQLKEKKGMGIDDVTDYMNAKGYKTISGKEKWDSRTITRIFEHVKTIRSETN